MFLRLSVLAALLSSSSGGSTESGSETVLTYVGQHVVLPCSFDISVDDDFPTVEWSKEGLDPDVVILYRDGCEDHDMKNPAYHYRTSFITPELKNGNVSLRIADVQLSDDGLYRCKRLWAKAPPDITPVRLVVAAVSEPELSVVSHEGGWSLEGGATLQCEATCWFPKPEIHFLDDQGNVMSTETEAKRHQEASGCYTVTKRVTLQSPTKRVTCRVRQPETNQTRHQQISAPARCQGHWITGPLLIVVAVAIVVMVILIILVLVLLYKRNCCSSAAAQKQSVTRQQSDQSSSSADPDGWNTTAEMLTREETVYQEQNNNNTLQLSPVVCQLHQPTLVPAPVASTSSSHAKNEKLPPDPGPKPNISRQNPARGHSIPSPSSLSSLDVSLSSTQSSVKPSKKTRSVSVSSDSTGAKFPKLQRQSSLTLSLNRFNVLADLKEESQHLMLEK